MYAATTLFSFHSPRQCEMLQTNNIQLNLKLGAIKATSMRLTTQYNITNGKLVKALADLNEVTAQCDQLQIELTKKSNVEKTKDAEMARMSRENATLLKERDAAKKFGQSVEAKNADLMTRNTKMRYNSFLSCLSHLVFTCPKNHCTNCLRCLLGKSSAK